MKIRFLLGVVPIIILSIFFNSQKTQAVIDQLPDNILNDLNTERDKYGLKLNNAETAKLLNAVAWKNKAAGWGLLSKPSGNRCPLGTSTISCDYLVKKTELVGFDSLSDAGGTCGSGNSSPYAGISEVFEDSRWVAPLDPAGFNPTPLPLEDCSGGGTPPTSPTPNPGPVIPPAPGGASEVSATTGWGGTLTFNPDNNTWLVVSFTSRNDGKGYSSRGRILSQDGKPVSAEFVIDGGRPDSGAPRVVYIPEAKKFFAVWAQSETEIITQIWGIFINPNGTLSGSAIKIFNNGQTMYLPAGADIQYDSVNKKIVIPISEGVYPTGDAVILITGVDGKLISKTVVTPPSSGAPHVAINPLKNEYCVAVRWFDETLNKGGIRTRAVNAITGALGPITLITDQSDGNIGLVYNSADDEYLVIYNKPGNDVYGKILASCDDSKAKEFLIQEQAGASHIAYNPKSNTYAIISQDQSTIRNQYTIIDASGNEISGGYVFTSGANGNYTPAIAANSNDGTYSATSSVDYATTRFVYNLGWPDVTTSRRASGPFASPTTLPVPSEGLPTDLAQFIAFIFTWSLRLIGLVIFVRFFYAGFLYFTAAGNTSNTTKAKDIMKNAVYGTLILFSAWLILNTINPDLVKGSFPLPGLSGVSGTTPVPTTPVPTTPVPTTPVPTTPVPGVTCTDTTALAARYNEPNPPQNAPELNTLIACIQSKLPAGTSVGSIFTIDQSRPLCNLTRGNRVCGTCSHAVNSCHYGGRTGTKGSLGIDYGNEKNGDKIIAAARACGTPPEKARCESASGARVDCSSASATHVHISEASCDAN